MTPKPGLPGSGPLTPTPSSTPLVPPAPSPTSQFPTPTPQFPPLALPIHPPARDTVDASYRFGSTQGGAREVHHGVEFLDPSGTPVYAAGAGEAVHAGPDAGFGLYRNFYGTVVILRHDLPGFPAPVYTLYAHLSESLVAPGETVSEGQLIGRVGYTGAATGSHLHFEVRFGENTYAAARNPELYLRPHASNGLLAGRLLDAAGRPLAIPNLVLEYLPDPPLPRRQLYYLTTYEDPALALLPPYAENFALGDLPPGPYKLSFIAYGYREILLEILPGQLTTLTLTVEPTP